MQWLAVPQVLQSLSQHWSSGERLSGAQVTNLISARNHMAGYDLCNELYKAAYDIAFYTEDYENEQYQDLATRLAPQYFVLVMEKGSEHVEFTDHLRDLVHTLVVVTRHEFEIAEANIIESFIVNIESFICVLYQLVD